MNYLYYWNGHKNFGDELSLYLVEKITGTKFSPARKSFNTKTLVAIGSLLEPKIISTKSIIWGTGTLRADSLALPPLRIFPLSRLLMNIGYRLSLPKPDIRAVRGPKTREALILLGYKCPELYGDPAILFPRFYKARPSKKRYVAGLILHHIQELMLPKDTLEAHNILPISILRETPEEIESFVDEIASCEQIFSASLHGIIVAQAYGVRAQWIQIEGQPIQGDDTHKFEDYFLGANQEVQHPVKISLTDDNLHRLLSIRAPDVRSFESADDLLKAFPFNEF